MLAGVFDRYELGVQNMCLIGMSLDVFHGCSKGVFDRYELGCVPRVCATGEVCV